MVVRDEIEYIRENILYHYEKGVDCFIVMDNQSRDGTRDELERLSQVMPLTVIDQTDYSYRQAEWATEMALRLRAAGVNWAIHIDADEFIATGEVPLKVAISGVDHPILCRRENVLPLLSFCRNTTYRPLRDSKLRVIKPIGKFPFHSEPAPTDFPFALREVMGKTIFPLKGLISVAAGNHSVHHELPTSPASEKILIRHYPVRRFEQFMARLDHWQQRFELNPPSGISSHIARWLKLRRQGLIKEEYYASAIPDEGAQLYLDEGRLLLDDFGEQLLAQWPSLFAQPVVKQ